MTQRPAPEKFGSSGAGPLVALVAVAPGGVGLPDLDQRVAERLPVAVEDAARDDDPLAERLALVLAREVVVELPPTRSRPSSGPVISVIVCGR